MAKVKHLDDRKLFEMALKEVRNLKRTSRERNRMEKRE